MGHLVLIGEIIAICILHAIKINQSSPEAIPSAIDKTQPIDISFLNRHFEEARNERLRNLLYFDREEIYGRHFY